ncbi:putative uncharacterized protein [Cryptobacterium sp. CAG:338]|nr:putative uncharacterized protein [Cryptobacterium sp. CAG:338]
MRIIQYLKSSKVAVLLITLLLIVQAFADLSLPRYTSDLVDVGIQQGGIEHASPDEMSADTFNYICMLADEDTEQLIRDSYEQDTAGENESSTGENEASNYILSEYGKENRAELDSAIALPLVLVHMSDIMGDASSGVSGESNNAAYSLSSSEAPSSSGDVTALAQSAMQSGSFDWAQLYSAYESGAISKAEIQSFIDQARQAYGAIDDSLIQQQAIEAVKAEYEALGMDLGAIQLQYLAWLGAQMLGVAALMMAASISVGFVASRTAAKIARNLRERLFEKVVSFSDAEVQSFSAASLITRGTNDIQQIQMVLVMLLRMVLYAPILAIGGIIMVSQTNLAMSWIIVLAIVVIGIVIALLMALALPKFKIMQKLIDRVNLVSREMLTGMSVIRAFDRQEYEEARFDEASTALYKTQLFTNRVMTFMMPTMMLVMNGVSVLIVWVGGSYIDSGVIQTGDMIAFITYSMVIVMSFLMISMIAIMLPRADVAAQRVNEVLDTENSIHDPEESQVEKLDKNAKGLSVEFDNVTFAYNEGSDPVLKDISFVAEPGKTTAIIGSTGSGKSTIMKLIERFYEVTQGAIRVGGVDIRSMKQHELRRELGYVPQKAFLFSGTIESTIAYANEDMDEDRVRKAADIAQATEFITAKEQGFESEISQGGTNVSGGQRQRLSIARALASDARVLLFDDSFSALDYATDARLRHALATEAAGKTVLVVAQRIATVLNADKILVLEDGELVGSGTHKELLSTCPTYREIAQSQLSEEELKGGVA